MGLRNNHVALSHLTSVFLNGRFDRYPKRRGITRIKQLLKEGVNVALGHDDFQNPFFPFGYGDMIQALWAAVLLDHLNFSEGLISLITENARREWVLSTQSLPSEDLVILDARSLREQLSTLSPRFMVIRKGRIVAYTNRSGEVIINGSKVNPYEILSQFGVEAKRKS